MNEFKSLIIEISGGCNAKCKWCITGRTNRKGWNKENNFMSLSEFKKLYKHLLSCQVISKESEIMLYNWGEPYLNPQAMDIFQYLTVENQNYSLSTNASIFHPAHTDYIYGKLRSLTVSICGFSQNSYNRIHKFSFEKIRSNIRLIIQDMKSHGFHGEVILAFHVYQFNLGELKDAAIFAKELGAKFKPYYAYFNGLSLASEYLNDSMIYSELKEAGKDLFLYYVEDQLKERPTEYLCPLTNILTIDEKSRLVLCCAADHQSDEYILSDVFKLNNATQIRHLINENYYNSKTCSICRNSGMDYWLTNYRELEVKNFE